jgi:outer membrane biosynthesis protein TonB
VPDPLSILRLAALLAFIGLVAVGLWLLDVAWWVVPPVMAVALLIAWTIEWLAWRGTAETTVVRETLIAPPPVAEPLPAPSEAIVPPVPVQAQPAPPPRAREPAPEAEREPATEPSREPEPVAAAPAPQEEPIRESRRTRRLRLRAVPAPAATAEPAPQPPPHPATPTVVPFQPRTVERREWNLWDLERLAHEEARDHPERRDEWSFLFVHLRRFAEADGSLPAEFDGLVRESFGGLLDAPSR